MDVGGGDLPAMDSEEVANVPGGNDVGDVQNAMVTGRHIRDDVIKSSNSYLPPSQAAQIIASAAGSALPAMSDGLGPSTTLSGGEHSLGAAGTESTDTGSNKKRTHSLRTSKECSSTKAKRRSTGILNTAMVRVSFYMARTNHSLNCYIYMPFSSQYWTPSFSFFAVFSKLQGWARSQAKELEAFEKAHKTKFQGRTGSRFTGQRIT